MHKITPDVLYQARSFASQNRQEESVGILFDFGEITFYPVENKAKNKRDSFKLDPIYSLLSKRIYCIFHSHPHGDCYPSEEDLRSSRSSGLSLLVYSCIYDNFLFFDGEKCKQIKE
tara:strand:+ start:654 stop:1001 length:348 start_codon:yes stop_codon:yes gene_type:complete